MTLPPKSLCAALAAVLLTLAPRAEAAGQAPNGSNRPNHFSGAGNEKLDEELSRRAFVSSSSQRSKVIVRLQAGQSLPAALTAYQKARLDVINAYVLDVPDALLGQMVSQASV